MPTRRPQAAARRRLLALTRHRPATPAQLRRWVRVVTGLDITDRVLGERSTPPLLYLWHAYRTGGDAVVWAPRGGGKTQLGAMATVIDLVFKPGVQARILGGSLEQSGRMYEHLLALLDRPHLRGVAVASTQRKLVVPGGGQAAVLAGSQRSVRGVRVHTVRCDEVELFDPELWQAVQLTTRSGRCGDQLVRGSVEALSTMHRPGGLMGSLVDDASTHAGGAAGQRRRAVFRWNALDVAARCEPDRPCDGCPLWDDCGGRLKDADGFIPVQDLIDQRGRVDSATWRAELMCERPSTSASVYPMFDAAVHVTPDEAVAAPEALLVCGMDFGMRSPTVILWARVTGSGPASSVHVLDEHHANGLTLDQHLRTLSAHRLGCPAWIGIDPAGGQRNSHTGLSDTDLLRAAGHRVRDRRAPLTDGIREVRRRLEQRTLTIHPRCVHLITAMRTYHFDPRRPADQVPVKDGPDHAADALRYLVINLGAGPQPVEVRRWA
jgi:hypothetical protein